MDKKNIIVEQFFGILKSSQDNDFNENYQKMSGVDMEHLQNFQNQYNLNDEQMSLLENIVIDPSILETIEQSIQNLQNITSNLSNQTGIPFIDNFVNSFNNMYTNYQQINTLLQEYSEAINQANIKKKE